MAKSPRSSVPPVNKYGRFKTTIEFPPDVWAKVKLVAAEKRITVNKVVIDVCEQVLGLATQEEIDKVLPGYLKDRTGSKPLMPAPKPVAATQHIVWPWENCVISTTPTLTTEPEPAATPAPAPAKIKQPRKIAEQTPPGSPKRYSEAAKLLVEGLKELDS